MGNFVRCQTLRGMDAEPGFIGSNDGTGAVSGNAPAQGGDVPVPTRSSTRTRPTTSSEPCAPRMTA